MDDTQFEALSSRLEREAAEHPRWYRLKVIGLAMLGYLFIAGILLGIVGVIAALVAAAVSVHGSAYVVVKLLGVLIPLGWIILRSLWVSLPPPEGLQIDLADAPALRSTIEKLKHTLGTPDIDVVLLTMEFNAGVIQIPRFGMFGWPRNYLVIGWPMLLALSAEGVTSVLAHEFGHLSGAHGRFAAWVYRVRQTWFGLMTTLDANGQWGTGLFRWFFNWYAPSFGAYTFVLARKHEFAADRMAARATGARTTAETLLATVVLESHLDAGFWPKLKELALAAETPPDDVFTRMRKALEENIPDESAEKWSSKARCFRTGGADTHPALSDRLAVLGCPDVRFRPARGTCAADVFFPGEAGACLERTLSAKWRENVAEAWAQTHTDGVGTVNRLAELETLEQTGEYSLDAAVERLRHVGELHGVEATGPLLDELIRQAPDHPQVCYGMGRLLLHRGDQAGVAYIDKAMNADPDAVLNGCGLIIEFFYERGMRDAAEPYLLRQKSRMQVLMKDQEERETLPFSDVYLPHELPPDVVAGIAKALTQYEFLCEAYLVRRKLTYCPEIPLYILGLRLSTSFFRMWSGAAEEGRKLSERIANEIPLPGQFLILHLHEENEPLLAHVKAVNHSRISVKSS